LYNSISYIYVIGTLSKLAKVPIKKALLLGLDAHELNLSPTLSL